MITKLEIQIAINKCTIEISGCDRRIANLKEVHRHMNNRFSADHLQEAIKQRTELIAKRQHLEQTLGDF